MSRCEPRPALLVPAAAALLVLAGCTPTDTATQLPDPEPATEVTLSTEHLEGTGTTGVPGAALPIPADARSLVVDFTCEGGGEFAVELGDAMVLGQATFNGTCDGSSSSRGPSPRRRDTRCTCGWRTVSCGPPTRSSPPPSSPRTPR